MREQYDEEKLKSIILGVGEAPDFGAQYDSLIDRPFVRHSELINEIGVMETLVRAQERVRELSTQPDIINIDMYPQYGWGLTIQYHQVIGRDEYINNQMRAWRQTSPAHNYKSYLHRTLWLRNLSSIRNIYIKLLLEHKITLNDFADLVDTKDAEVDLVGLCSEEPPQNQNFFI